MTRCGVTALRRAAAPPQIARLSIRELARYRRAADKSSPIHSCETHSEASATGQNARDRARLAVRAGPQRAGTARPPVEMALERFLRWISGDEQVARPVAYRGPACARIQASGAAGGR